MMQLQSVLSFPGCVLQIVLLFCGSNWASSLHKPPQIVEELNKQMVLRLGNFNRFVLKCHGDADPPPTCQWYKNNQPFSPDSPDSKGISLVSDDEHSKLDFYDPAPYHEGYYHCEATNTLGKAKSTVSHVAPSFPAPPEGSLAPVFIKGPVTEVNTIGSRVELSCEAEGIPTPSISWTKNGEALQSVSTGSSLVIPSLSNDDVANYACNASNIAGYQYTNIIVSILTVVARIKEGPMKYTKAMEGANVSLPCKVDGYPKPNISWTVNGTVIVDSDKYGVDTESGELSVKQVTVKDEGEYKCKATNYAEDTAEGYLIVSSKEMCPWSALSQWIFPLFLAMSISLNLFLFFLKTKEKKRNNLVVNHREDVETETEREEQQDSVQTSFFAPQTETRGIRGRKISRTG